MHFPPTEFEQVAFTPDGKVALDRNCKGVQFSFQYLGLNFSAQVRAGENGSALQLVAPIAPFPYTAESAPLRLTTQAVVTASQSNSSCRLMVSRQRQIYCVGRAHVDPSWTPVELISSAVALLFEARPYLEIMREIMPIWATTTATAA